LVDVDFLVNVGFVFFLDFLKVGVGFGIGFLNNRDIGVGFDLT